MHSFTFLCCGHPNITAKHKTTIEFTSEKEITVKGDCILGTSVSENFTMIPKLIKEKIKKQGSNIEVQIVVDEITEIISGEGSPDLDLSDKNAMIIRKSSFTCSKTLMIKANKSANDISREIVAKMKNTNSIMHVTIQVE